MGEPAEPRVLAERLDEGLAILAGLWSGETVSYQGQHYQIGGLRLSPTPIQQPRIPIWVGGDWLVKGVRRRLTHWDGCCVYKGTPGTEAYRPLMGDDVRAIISLVAQERGTAEGFMVCVGGQERQPDWDQERDYMRSLAAAGATWWNEWVPLADPERTWAAISRGPLRID